MSILVSMIRYIQHKTNDPRIAANPNNYQVQMKCNIPYLPDDTTDHLLDVYSPNGYKKEVDGTLAVVINIHGGAYISCYKEVNQQQGQYFASQGCHCVNMNYTLMPEGDMKTVMQEIAAVLAWIDANADSYGFDRDKIYLTGDSAGGHFVLMYAAAQGHEKLGTYYGIPDLDVKIKRFAANCPIGDFNCLTEGKDMLFKIMHHALKKHLRDQEYVYNTDVTNFLDEKYPEVFILTTPTDNLLFEVTKKIHISMETKQVYHKYKEYEGKENKLEHVFSVLNPDWTESKETNEDILQWFQIK